MGAEGMEHALGIQSGSEGKSQKPGIAVKASFPQQHLDVPVPQHDRRGVVPVLRGMLRRGARQLAVFFDIFDARFAEGNESFKWGSPGAQGRRSEDELPLEFGFGVAQEGHHEPRPAAETAENRSLPDVGPAREHVHGDGVHAMFGHEIPGSLEEPFAVTGGVAALRLRPERRSGPDGDEAHKNILALGILSGPQSV
jgi:hypothetical protein